MTVVPTSEGEENDGVIWFRCPQCQGFLPKLSGTDQTETEAAGQHNGDAVPVIPAAEKSSGQDGAGDKDMPWDSPADMMAEQVVEAGEGQVTSPFLPEDDEAQPPPTPESDQGSAKKAADKPAEPAEPIPEYAALLAESDVAAATPYRPWGTYEVGQCVHHLAWEDCGVVVAKEDLPGGRKIIKCYFEDAGVVRLIEQAPR